jgi:5-oxoprolinase (ATP-hydrolysing)
MLMHSPSYPQHEARIGTIARELGFTQISLSSEIIPMVKIVSRGFTATLDAYLNPFIQRYLANFVAGFDSDISKTRIFFM